MEAQLKFVNSNKDSMKMETHFKDEGGELCSTGAFLDLGEGAGAGAGLGNF